MDDGCGERTGWRDFKDGRDDGEVNKYMFLRNFEGRRQVYDDVGVVFGGGKEDNWSRKKLAHGPFLQDAGVVDALRGSKHRKGRERWTMFYIQNINFLGPFQPYPCDVSMQKTVKVKPLFSGFS
jgi:hypothetical protein